MFAGIKKAVPGFRRFLDSYYLVNGGLLLSYLLTREYYLRHGKPQYSRFTSNESFLGMELQAFGMYAIMLAVRFLRRQSIDQFMFDVLMFGKVVLLLMVFNCDWRLFIYYVILFAMSFMMFAQPIYDGPGSDKIEFLTPASFADKVKKSPPDTYWLVEFYAPWASACVHLEPLFAEVSQQYTTQHLRFGKLDVSRWPAVGQQNKVNVGGLSAQLPTLVMFKGGNELGRVPRVFKDGTVAKARLRKKDIVASFELEMLRSKTQFSATKAKLSTEGTNGKKAQ